MEVPPRALLRGFFHVEALLADRYREALAEIGAGQTQLPSFHVDAAGYSPQIAAERDDPFYLGNPLEPRGVIVSAEQLAAPLVHPGFGYAAPAYRKLVAGVRRAIARLALGEALIAEAEPSASGIARPKELADASRFQLRFRTPGGLVRGTRRLEEMKREFLESDRRWLDDDFIEELAKLARQVREVGKLPPELSGSTHPLLPWFSPAFGGSYVFDEGAKAITYVLCAETQVAESAGRSARDHEVREHPLDVDEALRVLLEHEVLRFDPRKLRDDPVVLDAALYWVAVDHLLGRDPERSLERLSLRELDGLVRGDGDPPRAYVELLEVKRRIETRGSARLPEGVSPLTRLRVLWPSSRRSAVRRFVRHLRSFLDPIHLEQTWWAAPDLFFWRLPRLDPARRDHFARWLESRRAA